MSALLLVSLIAAAAGALVFVGYKFGERAKAQAVKYEQEAKQLYVELHSRVSAKLTAVKAEIEGIEKSGYADVTSAIQRIKKLF